MDNNIESEVPMVDVGTEGLPDVQEVEERSEVSVEEVVDSNINGDASESIIEQESESTEDKPYTLEGVEYHGIAMNIELPAEAVQMLKAANLEADKVVDEFFKDGLSEATKEALYEKHGKFIVDSLIAQMTNTLDRAEEGYTQSKDKAFNAIAEAIGGEGEWTKMEQFANTLPKEDIDAFNSAMASGNPYFQKLAAMDLHRRMVGDTPVAMQEDGTVKNLDLVEPKGGASTEKTVCTKQEYLDAFKNGEYKKDPAKWDALRRNGMAKGL